jgi:serine/threonine-protein kinase
MAAPPVPLSGALRERYRFERELGRGATATVYLAHDLRHDRPVALKVLHAEVAAVLGTERFLREIRTTARLDHPHILPVFDSGEAAGTLWYTMPHVEGESLRGRLRRRGQLPIEEAVQIAREVADALDYAHAEDVVHRDIKPENILLSGPPLHARVADFGVAWALEAAGADRLTETGLAVGTPAYMSPEQAGAEPVDARTDVYALGCVLYEMLAGEPPYPGPSVQAILARRFLEPAPSVRRIRETVPERLDQAVAKALARAPADRFQTAAELAEAITADDHEPPSFAPGGRPWRRPALPSALAFVLGLLVTATMGMLVWRRSHPPGGPGRAEEEVGAAPAEAPSVAVLYLKNLSADSASAYLGDGLTEEITSRLSQIPRLRVKSRGAVRRFRGTAAEDPTELGEALGVDYLLEGSARRVGDRVRVSVGLVKAADGFQVWGDDFDRPLTDVLSVQEEIARQVVTRIAGQLAPEERAALARRPTEDPQAYDHYLRGQYWVARRSFANVQRAITEYQRAVDLDPTFAAAHARIGYAYALWDDYGWHSPSLPLDSVLPRAMAASVRALVLDSTSSDGWLARGYVLLRRYPDSIASVRRAYDKALELDSLNAEAFHRLGTLLGGTLARDSAGLAMLHRSLQLEPARGAALEYIGRIYLLEHRCPAAMRWLDSAASVDPGLVSTYMTRGRCRLELGDTAGALSDRHTALSLPDRPGWIQWIYPELAIADGDSTQVTAAAESLLDVLPTARQYQAMDLTHRVELFRAIGALIVLGQADRALGILGRLEPPIGMGWWRWPEYDALRGNPAFDRLVEQSRALGERIE